MLAVVTQRVSTDGLLEILLKWGASDAVPLSEMFGYVGDLRSKTQGRAVYSMSFDSYAEVPRNVADEIIAKAKGE